MRAAVTRILLGCAVIMLVTGMVLIPSSAQQSSTKAKPAAEPKLQGDYQNPRPGQPGHQPHKEWQGDYPTLEALKNFKVVRSFNPPAGFLGNMAYDRESGRLWLISLGPPANTKNSSVLYEVDPANGKVLAQAKMPFQGDFGDPVFIDGHLYQGIFHESKLYKISTAAKDFGKIVKTVPLPKLVDLNLVDEAHPLPFIEFGGVGVTPDKNILFHADDVGEFIVVSPESGKLLSRVRTLKALGGLDVATGPQGDMLVLANSDPRGGYCALSFPPAISRTPEQKDISWALLDGKTGEVLASIRTQNSRAYAGTVALMKHEQVAHTPYGRFTFLATGEEGILTIEWTPAKDAY